ncbi:alpha/beta hydrolase [Nocardiopsis sp. NPDC055879]
MAETLTTATVSNDNPDTADNDATLAPDATTTWQSTDTHMGRANWLVDTANEADDNADEIVLVGNSGTSAQHASELRFPPANVHATTAKNDGITSLTDLTHGTGPTSPEFGATVFESDEGSEGGQWLLEDAHSKYFHEDTASLEHMGEIIVGQH